VKAQFYLEIAGGAVLILFGILFFVYLPQTFTEVTTVLIFVVAGVLVIRRAILRWTQVRIREEIAKNSPKKNPPSKPATKKRR
jgi:hypothetical protein